VAHCSKCSSSRPFLESTPSLNPHFQPSTQPPTKFAPALGSYLLATRLTGRLYDRAAAAHGDAHECVGPDCFKEAFLILAALSALSTVACGVAAARSRRVYRQICRHLHEVQEAEAQLSP